MDELEIKQVRAKKMMLWVGMISISMTFAGLTSAYVVSSSRADWLDKFQIPIAFTISTFLIVLSSATFYSAKKLLIKKKIRKTELLTFLPLFSACYLFIFNLKVLEILLIRDIILLEQKVQ